MKKIFVIAISIGLIVLSSSIFAKPWEGPRLSEEELEITETNPDDANKANTSATLKEIAKRYFIFSYIDAYKTKSLEINKSVSENGQSSITNPAFGLVVANGLINGPRAPNSNSLFFLSVGIDIFSFFSKDTSAEDFANKQKLDYENYTVPSLWLINMKDNSGDGSVETLESNKKKLSENFNNAQDILLSSSLKCDIGYYYVTTVFGKRMSYYNHIPGVFHGRNYLCGYEGSDLSPGDARKEFATMSSQRTKDGPWLTRIVMTKLDKKTSINKVLGTTNSTKDLVAAELYKKIKPSLNNDWYAIYTAPNSSGVWKTYVINGDLSMEFDIPPKP